MDKRLRSRKRITVQSVESAGYILAYEDISPEFSKVKSKLFSIEKEMTKRFREDIYHRDCYIKSFADKLVAVNPFSLGQNWLRGFVLGTKRYRSDILFRIQLIDYCIQQLITLKDIRPLPDEFDTSVLECQGMKIVLYGVEPAFLKLDLANENKLSGSMQFCGKDKKFINEQLQEAELVYFEEICRVEEFYFGNVFLKHSDGTVISLQELMLKYFYAIKCPDFESKIPAYIKDFRRNTSAFDHDLSVRKMLFPTISFSDVEMPPSTCNCCINCDHAPPSFNTISESADYSISRSSNLTCQSESAYSSISQITCRSAVSPSTDQQSVSAISESAATEIFEIENQCSRLIDKILVVGGDPNNSFRAVNSFTETTLDSETFQMLERLRLRDMTSCQKYAIPAILSGQNVTLIDGPTAGKTVGVLIALVSLIRKNCKAKQNGLGARAVIVCPYSAQCEQVQEICLQIIQGRSRIFDVSSDPVTVNVAYGLGIELEKKNLIELLKGYDILACTPKRLLRLLENEVAFDFKRLSHIVFDDMNTLLNSYSTEIFQIFAHVRRKPKLPQRIIISNHWLPTLKSFVNDDVEHRRGSLLIPNYLDAAVFVHLNTVWRYIADDYKKIRDITDLLSNDIKVRNILIVFNDEDDIDLVYDLIRRRCPRQMSIIRDISYLNSDIVRNWQTDMLEGRHPVLFCNDFTLCDLHIYEADCLIHYSLPKSKKTFLFRFSVLLDRLQSVANEIIKSDRKPIHPLKRAQMYIYSNMENVKHFPAIVEIMEQLRAQIPTNLKECIQKEFHKNEVLKKEIDICPNLKEFGRCVRESRCEFRHIVLQEDIPDANLPSNGYVRVHILRTISATHYHVRILEHAVQTIGPWTRVEGQSHLGIISLKLKNYFAENENIKMCVKNEIGDIVAIKKNDHYYRVKIIKFLQARDKEENENSVDPERAVIKSIDEEWQEEVLTMRLIQLPTPLVLIPPAIVDVFICNLLPVDEDIAWGKQITNIVREKITIFQGTEKCYFVGKVELVLGRTLWLDSLKCEKQTAAFKNTITIFSISKMLREQQLAIRHDHHLPLLLQKCKDAGLEKVESSISNGYHESELINAVNGEEVSSKEMFLKPLPVKAKQERIASSSVSKNALKPLVEWRQDSSHVIITVAVNSDNFIVLPLKKGRKTRLYFRCCMDQKLYEFNEVLFSTILISSVNSRKSGVSVCIKMAKLLKGIKWDQLFRTKIPLKWVRKDRNFIDSSDDDSHLELRQKLTDVPVTNKTASYLRKNDVCRHPDEFDDRSNSNSDSADDMSDASVRGYDSDN